MSKEQNLRKYLTHVLTVTPDKSPRLLEALVKNAKEFAKDNSQESYIQIVRAQLNKNKGKKVKELIRYIYIFDSLVKQAKSYRQQVAQVIGQIFVLLFSVFFENNFQSEVQDLKMVRKSWPTLLPDDVLNDIQKQVLSKFNYNLDKGFSKKKIDELTTYYSTKMKLAPDVYNKYLPSIDSIKQTNNFSNNYTNNYTNNIEQFPPDLDDQPIVKRRKLMPQYGTSIPNNQISSIPTNSYTPPPQTMSYQPSNYQTHNYQSQQNYMYQQHPIQYQSIPIQQVQPQQHMQMNNSYYYQNNMQQMGGYNNYYNNQSLYGNTTNNINNGMMNNINNNMNNGINKINNGINSNMNMNMNMNDYYKMGGYYDPRMQAESKVRQRQETSKPKQFASSKYKELMSFGRYRCPCCGMVSNRRDYFDMHLKSHFQQSKKSYQSLKKQTPIVRLTALSLKEWMPSESKDNQNKYFVQINKYPENTCKLCSGIFQSGWDTTLEAWVYKDVVLVELYNNSQRCSMHFPCFETINQNKSTSQ